MLWSETEPCIAYLLRRDAYFSSVSSMDSACAVNVSSTLCAEYIPIGELYCCGMNTFTRPLPTAGCHCCCCCWRLICSIAAERGGGSPATPAAGSTDPPIQHIRLHAPAARTWLMFCILHTQRDSSDRFYGASASKSINMQLALVSAADVHCAYAVVTLRFDCLVWRTGLTLLNGFSFLVIFFFFILGRAVD